MATNKSNPLLKIIVPMALVLIIVVAIVAFRDKKTQKTGKEDSLAVYNLTKAEQQELGLADGDTAYDTLRTLLGTIKQTKADVAKVKRDNQRLLEENQSLKDQSSDVDSQIRQAVTAKQAELQSTFDKRLSELEQQLENKLQQLSSISTSGVAGEHTEETMPIQNTESASNEINWISPEGMSLLDEKGHPLSAFTGNTESGSRFNIFKALDKSELGQAATRLHGKPNQYEEIPPTPYFTIARNATLVGSVAMTALIGRVPIEGALTDPFPFKVIIGQENLMANGLELPEIEGAIVAGKASGDWTLSCVKGDVESITFIFRDGRIVSLPQDGNGSNTNGNEQLGWLSTPSGIPCIPGERKTNAPEFLANQFLLAGAEAAAQGLAQSQITTEAGTNGIRQAVSGDAGKFALGQGIAGGVKAAADWYRQRYGNMFDAIYVPPGKKVVVNITKTLRIDYDKNARKVNYDQSTNSQAMD